MYTKKIYLSGGDFHELQEVFSHVKGAVDTKVGYINAAMPQPSYEQVAQGEVDAVMGLEVAYNPKEVDLSSLLDLFFTVVNPHVRDQEGDCKGRMYCSGVYYSAAEDEPMVEFHMNFIRNRGKPPVAANAALTMNDPNCNPKLARGFFTEAAPLQNFYRAEEAHQHYLRRNPQTKTRIDINLLEELHVIEKDAD